MFRAKKGAFVGQIDANFIGNGSCTVMRRSAVEAVGGYDVSLRARDAQGSEDHALYLALAERWNFAVVPQYLVAYRHHADCMSQDTARMARSEMFVITDLSRRRVDLSGYRVGRGLASVYEVPLMTALRGHEWNSVRGLFCHAVQGGAWCIVDLMGRRLSKRLADYWLRRFSEKTHQGKVTSIEAFWSIDCTKIVTPTGIMNAFGERSASSGSREA
jgi:hypothetical protein